MKNQSVSFEWKEDWSFWAHCQARVTATPQKHHAENHMATVGLLVAFQRWIDLKNVEKLSLAACCLCIQCFVECHTMSWHNKTHKAQQNKGNDNVIKDFVECIQWKKIVRGDTDDCAVKNADETNAHFSPFFECATADRGSRIVAVPQANG